MSQYFHLVQFKRTGSGGCHLDREDSSGVFVWCLPLLGY